MKVLVTGGGGFIGRAVVQRLAMRGDEVIVLARGDYPHLREMGATTIRGDITDANVVLKAMAGCDAVMHIAAKAGDWGSYDSFYQPNVVGTQNILAACRVHGIQKLVFTGSPSSIDPGYPIENVDESLPYPEKFVSVYSQTKAISEKMVLDANDGTLATVSLRPSLVWGPGEENILSRVIRIAEMGVFPRIGTSESLNAITYIDHVADAHVTALDKIAIGADIAGKAYFLADAPRDAQAFLLELLEAVGYTPRVVHIPRPIALGVAWILQTIWRLPFLRGEPRLTIFRVRQLITSRWFDTSAAQRDLNYSEMVSLEEGLKRVAAHHQST